MPPVEPLLPFNMAAGANMLRAVKVLQKASIDALTSGDGRGLHVVEMAAILDRELGFSCLYAALEAMLTATGYREGDTPNEPIQQALAALAKARGETPDA